MAEGEQKKAPGRPKKTDAEKLKELQVKFKKVEEENKALSKFAMDELDGTVQYRESDAVLRLQEHKAKAAGFGNSINKWVRSLARQAVGIDSRE